MFADFDCHMWVGYIYRPKAAAEMMFQLIAGRAERAAVIVTTNLPFLGMDHDVPNARLCKAMLDRLVAGSILVTFTNARALGASTAVFAT